MTNLKPFSGKVKESIQSYFNQNLVIRSYLENGFEATVSSKRNIVSLWKGHFTVSCKFLRDEVEITFSESEASVRIYLNQNLVIERFLENGFKASLSSKTNVVSVSKRRFTIFCKFLSGEFETIL